MKSYLGKCTILISPKLVISLISFRCTGDENGDRDDDDGDDRDGDGDGCSIFSEHEPCSICTNNAGHIFMKTDGVIRIFDILLSLSFSEY